MKKVKLIDIIPTMFGVIAIFGLVLLTLFSPNSNPGTVSSLGPLLLYGAGATSLLTGLISVIGAGSRRALGKLHILNIAWVLLLGVFFAWGAYIAITWR